MADYGRTMAKVIKTYIGKTRINIGLEEAVKHAINIEELATIQSEDRI